MFKILDAVIKLSVFNSNLKILLVVDDLVKGHLNHLNIKQENTQTSAQCPQVFIYGCILFKMNSGHIMAISIDHD